MVTSSSKDSQATTHPSRRAALLGGAVALGLAACGDGVSAGGAPSGSSAAPAPTSSPTPTPTPTLAQLPRGGRTIFPAYRLFGYCGSPVAEALGRLGIGDLDVRVDELVARGAQFAGGRQVLPVLELIATLVHATPGADGMYRSWVSTAVVDEYLAAARRHHALLLLNIQPGRASMLDECRHWESYLKEPDVGVALDPEWAVKKGQVPGKVFGSTTGAELDACAAYLAGLVQDHALPEKVMVYHQLHLSIVHDEAALHAHRGVALVKSVDGIGAPADKVKAYDKVMAQAPAMVHPGFKLFFEEDARSGPLMTPTQVMALQPQPEYVMYE